MENKENPPSRNVLLEAYKKLHIHSRKGDSLFRKEATRLHAQAMVYLSSVEFSDKFQIVRFEDFTSDAIKSAANPYEGSLDNIHTAYKNLEKFGINLMRYPWRREFYSVKLYTSFFRDGIESRVPFGPVVLGLYGYQPKSNELVAIQEELDLNTIALVSFELFLSAIEVTVMIAIAQDVHVSQYSYSMLRNILKARVQTIGDVTIASDYLRRHRSLSTSSKRIKLDSEHIQKLDSPKDDAKSDSIKSTLDRERPYHTTVSKADLKLHSTRSEIDRISQTTGSNKVKSGHHPQLNHDQLHFGQDLKNIQSKKTREAHPVKMTRYLLYPPHTGEGNPVGNPSQVAFDSKLATLGTVIHAQPNDVAPLLVDISDADLYGEVNSFDNSTMAQKLATLPGFNGGLQTSDLLASNVRNPGNAGFHPSETPLSASVVRQGDTESDYENIWESSYVHTTGPYTLISAAHPYGQVADTSHPAMGIPPPVYSQQGYGTPPEQQLGDEGWVLFTDKVSNMTLQNNTGPIDSKTRLNTLSSTNMTSGGSPGVQRSGLEDIGAHVAPPECAKLNHSPNLASLNRKTGAHKSFAEAVQFRSSNQKIPGEVSSKRVYQKLPDVIESHGGDQYYYPDIYSQGTSVGTGRSLPSHPQAQGSKIAALVPALPTTSSSIVTSSPHSVLVSAGNIPVTSAKVTRSGRVYSPPERDRELDVRTDEGQITDIPSSSVINYKSKDLASAIKTCYFCVKKATHECKTCSKACCKYHADELKGVHCRMTSEGHVFVERRALSVKIVSVASREASSTKRLLHPGSHIENDPQIKVDLKLECESKSRDDTKPQAHTENCGKTLCDFCNLVGTFLICGKCHKIVCTPCIKIYDADICGTDKGNHHFIALTGGPDTEESWSCKRCTFLNSPEYGVCAMCSATRGVHGPEFPASGSRKCQECTFGNEEGVEICTMCSKTLDQGKPETYI